MGTLASTPDKSAGSPRGVAELIRQYTLKTNRNVSQLEGRTQSRICATTRRRIGFKPDIWKGKVHLVCTMVKLALVMAELDGVICSHPLDVCQH
jgi:hypothetical protein